MAAVPIPTSVEQLDKAWFDAVLPDEVTDARVLKVIHGTATKVKMSLSIRTGRARPEVRTVWIKTGLEPHSKQIGTEKVYAGETFFYRNFGGRFDTRTPECLYADSDADGNSIIVLDDLERVGAEFTEPAAAGTPDRIAAGLEAIARYQAASWMDPDLWAIDWLRGGGSFDAADCIAWIWNPEHWEDYRHRPRFSVLHPSLADRALLERTHRRLRTNWLRRVPWALSHGDAHYGQLYTMPDGEARLIDWQCVQVAHHMQDVANMLVSGLTVEDRRATEADLLAHYLERLAAFGVADVPTHGDAFDALRAYAFHQMSWVMCLIEMQPEENCMAIAERASAAVMDYGSVELILNN